MIHHHVEKAVISIPYNRDAIGSRSCVFFFFAASLSRYEVVKNTRYFAMWRIFLQQSIFYDRVRFWASRLADNELEGRGTLISTPSNSSACFRQISNHYSQEGRLNSRVIECDALLKRSWERGEEHLEVARSI